MLEIGKSCLQMVECIGPKFTFRIDEKVYDYRIYSSSLDPFRIIGHVLGKQKIDYEERRIIKSDGTELIIYVDLKNQKVLEQVTNEVLTNRCADMESSDVNIIRQLPFAVAMETSDAIREFKFKHNIYPSVRGGYNIKVDINYGERPDLERYCYYDSRVWD